MHSSCHLIYADEPFTQKSARYKTGEAVIPSEAKASAVSSAERISRAGRQDSSLRSE